uniref:Uncharacterized protein n=1 Tax=Anguilla anguilla TaxID=7936 RepID=A0A0E9UUV5_ANGAN
MTLVNRTGKEYKAG